MLPPLACGTKVFFIPCHTSRAITPFCCFLLLCRFGSGYIATLLDVPLINITAGTWQLFGPPAPPSNSSVQLAGTEVAVVSPTGDYTVDFNGGYQFLPYNVTRIYLSVSFLVPSSAAAQGGSAEFSMALSTALAPPSPPPPSPSPPLPPSPYPPSLPPMPAYTINFTLVSLVTSQTPLTDSMAVEDAAQLSDALRAYIDSQAVQATVDVDSVSVNAAKRRQATQVQQQQRRQAQQANTYTVSA